MNCSILAIETPTKIFIREEVNTPIKLNYSSEKRFSPSESVRKLLRQISRVHSYQFHIEFKFLELTEIELTQKTVDEITQYFIEETPDLSDLVLKIEEIAVNQKMYKTFVKNYTSEEFRVDSCFSFLILCVLNYMHTFKKEVSVREAFFELLRLSSSDTLCQLCVEGDDSAAKLKLSQIHNLTIYRQLVTRIESQEDELSITSDDSFLDKPYVEEKEACSSFSSDFNVDGFHDVPDEDKFNPFDTDSEVHEERTESFQIFDTLSSEIQGERNEKFNPFDTVSEHSFLDEHSNVGKMMNSTEIFNPYSDDSESESLNKSNKVFVRQELKCQLCDKKFSNNYNRKLHQVSVHHFFPKGMHIYSCVYPKCKFVNGSKILFDRHVPTHTKKSIKFFKDKAKCVLCNTNFANPSSLKRHTMRKH